jgi:acetyl-CoA C-acetyltransferase
MRSVSVIGMGETKMGKLPDRTLRDLISEAGEKAIADAGIDRSMIQAAYVGNLMADPSAGRAILVR